MNAKAFERGFLMPSDSGPRVPAYPNIQRTSLVSPKYQRTIKLSVIPDSTSVDHVLVRDFLFPWWADQDLASNITWTAGWTSDNVGTDPTGATYPANQLIEGSGFMMTLLRGTGFTGSGLYTGASLTGQAPGAGVGIAPAAVMPEVDSEPWVWVPANTVVGLSVGFDGFTAGLPNPCNVDYTVTIQRRLSPDGQASEVTSSKTQSVASTLVFGNTWLTNSLLPPFPTAIAPKGAWMRVVSVSIRVSVPLPSVAFRFVVSMNVCTSSAVTAPNPFGPILVASSPSQRFFYPVVNGFSVLNSVTGSARQVAQNNRLLGMTATFDNVTQVVSQEGTADCVRYYGVDNYCVVSPPASTEGFPSYQRAYLKATTGVHVVTAPDVRFDSFVDNFQPYVVGTNTLESQPIMALYKRQALYLLRFSDADFATPTNYAVTLKVSFEFLTNDIMLRAEVPRGKLEALHQAVTTITTLNPFRPAAKGVPRMLTDPTPLGQTRTPRRRPKAKKVPTPKPKAKKAKMTPLAALQQHYVAGKVASPKP